MLWNCCGKITVNDGKIAKPQHPHLSFLLTDQSLLKRLRWKLTCVEGGGLAGLPWEYTATSPVVSQLSRASILHCDWNLRAGITVHCQICSSVSLIWKKKCTFQWLIVGYACLNAPNEYRNVTLCHKECTKYYNTWLTRGTKMVFFVRIVWKLLLWHNHVTHLLFNLFKPATPWQIWIACCLKKEKWQNYPRNC